MPPVQKMKLGALKKPVSLPWLYTAPKGGNLATSPLDWYESSPSPRLVKSYFRKVLRHFYLLAHSPLSIWMTQGRLKDTTCI